MIQSKIKVIIIAIVFSAILYSCEGANEEVTPHLDFQENNSEFGLVNVEQQRKLGATSQSNFIDEKDARAEENNGQ